MEITIQELYLLEQGSYQIIDIRNEIEVSHGRMPGAVHTTPDFIVENPDVDLKKSWSSAVPEERPVWKLHINWIYQDDQSI